MRVLVTGASGAIGSALVRGLPADGHTVRGLDRVPPADVVGDLFDADVLDGACAGVDGIVHLAANPDEASLTESLVSHVLGTEAVLQAARRAGIRRVVVASSNHAVGRHAKSDLPGGLLTTDVRPRPDTSYGVSKVALEALASHYVDRYALQIACLRIGSFQPRPQDERQLATWLSPDDMVRLAHACLTAPDLTFEVVYGVSANTRGWWDLEPGRRLGFEPQDDAERYAADVLAQPLSAEERASHAFVGGPFTTTQYDIPSEYSPEVPR